MGFFKKKGSDVIDFTHLKKRGIVNSEQRENEAIIPGTSSEVLDLSNGAQKNNDGTSYYKQFQNSSASINESSESNPLASFFSSNSQNDATPIESVNTNLYGSNYENNEGDNSSYTDKLRFARRKKLAEFNEMKIKIDDIDYKMNQLNEKIEELEKKLRGVGL